MSLESVYRRFRRSPAFSSILEAAESKTQQPEYIEEEQEEPYESEQQSERHVVSSSRFEEPQEPNRSLEETKEFAIRDSFSKEQYAQDRHSDQWTTDDAGYSYGAKAIPEPPPAPVTAAYQEQPQYAVTPEKRAMPTPAPAATPKTPERQSLFGSLKQAATSPTPKSAFGSFFSGASQALKSQTEAVLKKAVDTVNQVAAATDVVQKPVSPAPPPQIAPTVPTVSQPQPPMTVQGRSMSVSSHCNLCIFSF